MRPRSHNVRSCSGSGIELPFRIRPGGASGVDEEHERQEPGDLRVVREIPVQQARQPDGLVGQVDALKLAAGARGVTLVEDEVQHMQDEAHGAR